MGIELKIQQITRQEDGTYAARVQAINTGNGKVLQQATIVAETKIGFKDTLRPKLEKMIANLTTESPVRTIAQEALVELETELDLPNVIVP